MEWIGGCSSQIKWSLTNTPEYFLWAEMRMIEHGERLKVWWWQVSWEAGLNGGKVRERWEVGFLNFDAFTLLKADISSFNFTLIKTGIYTSCLHIEIEMFGCKTFINSFFTHRSLHYHPNFPFKIMSSSLKALVGAAIKEKAPNISMLNWGTLLRVWLVCGAAGPCRHLEHTEHCPSPASLLSTPPSTASTPRLAPQHHSSHN